MRRYTDVVLVQGSQGTVTPVAGASVRVLGHVSQTNASLFSDDGITPTANPVTTDSSGRFAFYIADGRYDFEVSGANFATFTVVDQEVSDITEANTGDTSFIAKGSLLSASANPASTGVVRLASGDVINWRNAANSADLSLSKNGSDLLLWPNAISAPSFASTVATGTAPLSVASTTNVPNLNASSLGGATFAAPGAIGGTTPGSGAFTTVSASGQVTSTVSTGTAPLSIASTTVVPNLNAQLHNGKTAPTGSIVGDTDTQTLSAKTLDISANTLKSSSNTAGHYPRNNGTQYVDNTIQAADVPAINLAASGNGGVTGNLPVTNLGSGTNADASHFWRGDGTWALGGVAGVTTVNTNTTAVTVNANTTSPQAMQSFAFGSGVLNSIGKSFRVTASGFFTPVNNTETVAIGLSINGSQVSVISFVPPNTNGRNWSFVFTYTVNATGANGSLFGTSTGMEIVSGNTAENSFMNSTGSGSINLTGVVTVAGSVVFTTASTTNSCTQSHMVVEQLN